MVGMGEERGEERTVFRFSSKRAYSSRTSCSRGERDSEVWEVWEVEKGWSGDSVDMFGWLGSRKGWLRGKCVVEWWWWWCCSRQAGGVCVLLMGARRVEVVLVNVDSLLYPDSVCGEKNVVPLTSQAV
jgi:hypothetical protein